MKFLSFAFGLLVGSVLLPFLVAKSVRDAPRKRADLDDLTSDRSIDA